MDKNRLIQIANHFDKIGAYTVSDEFENKFIRTAAAEKLIPRQKRVTDSVPTTAPQRFLDLIKLDFQQLVSSNQDLIQKKQMVFYLLQAILFF